MLKEFYSEHLYNPSPKFQLERVSKLFYLSTFLSINLLLFICAF